jgi:hypothetical protein
MNALSFTALMDEIAISKLFFHHSKKSGSG